MAANQPQLDELETRIGHTFSDRQVLLQALTHRSRAGVSNKDGDNVNYERLEFLGDAVLGLIAGEHLLRKFPQYDEGRLTKLKAFLVSARHLGRVAEKLDLGAHLRLGRGEEIAGGRRKVGLMVDALEALIAAVYLDGGLDAARGLVVGEIVTAQAIREANENLETANAKSALQEWLAARKLPAPSYHVLEEEGPHHAKVFTVEVRIGSYRVKANANTKKEAEQKAASKAMGKLPEVGSKARTPDETLSDC